MAKRISELGNGSPGLGKGQALLEAAPSVHMGTYSSVEAIAVGLNGGQTGA